MRNPDAERIYSDDAIILVLGPTGSGKSAFVNLISGSDLRIGTGLESCTGIVQYGKPFHLDGRRVVLIDTPGFDDTTRSDVDILNTIALFLAVLYERRKSLAGVLYFHRISDFRVGGTAVKNIKMFRKLCGDSALPNAVVVTNMWGEVNPREVGEAREAELKNKDAFFKQVIEKGAQMARHERTVTSAEAIIRPLLSKRPLPLLIQMELVDRGKDVLQTSAGKELNRELNAQISRYEAEMQELREEVDQAIKDRDVLMEKELKDRNEKLMEEMKKFKDETEKLASDYQKEKEKLEANLRRMEEEMRQDEARRKAEINKLKRVLETSADISAEEKAKLEERIKELENFVPQPGGVPTWVRPMYDIVATGTAVAIGVTAASPAIVVGAVLGWLVIQALGPRR